METIYWVYIFGSIALLSVVLFLLFYVKDMDFMRKMRLKRNYLVPNWLFLLLAVAAVGCVVILYLDIQNQTTALLQ
ncbi:hypothetical protein ACYSNR_17985 [Enterococcus sp. LJL128]|uniref:hypothetical protein n=1 Tax=Enterococcus sp. LJL51 TaxID=3416656 RepID=UPI003CFB6011